MENSLQITNKPLFDDLKSFCQLNKIEDIEAFKVECFRKGFYIEKYGLLGEGEEIEPWEIVHETDCSECDNKLKQIGETLQAMRQTIADKDNEIETLKNKSQELGEIIKTRLARFHPGSNLKQTL